jgi:hypothetical protein
MRGKRERLMRGMRCWRGREEWEEAGSGKGGASREKDEDLI